jgi:S-methylmethionine-dependent homocysteine/selenocysteine methylase
LTCIGAWTWVDGMSGARWLTALSRSRMTLGGCCETDARHIAALMHVRLPTINPGDST